MRPFFLAIFLVISISSNAVVNADIVDEIVLHFRNGNSKEIAKKFAPSIELLIIDQEDVYSKAQSEQILKDFFIKNPPQKTTLLHRLNTNPNYNYGIFSMQTKSAKYRVAITFMKQRGSNMFLISELRIERD